MQLNTTHKLILKYTLYILGVVAYFTVVQLLLVQNSITNQQLILLLIPLVILAYFFNTKLEKSSLSIANNPLSQRENEVAQCAAQGKANKQIAEELFISENTVKTHIKSILSKLELNNRTQIAQWYYQNQHHPEG